MGSVVAGFICSPESHVLCTAGFICSAKPRAPLHCLILRVEKT